MANYNTPIEEFWANLPAPIKNKFFIALVIFFALMIFFAKADPITQWRLQRTVDQLREDKEYYTRKIEEAKQDRLDLEINKEKFAREKYYMKKQNEDVFIIVDEEEEEKN